MFQSILRYYFDTIPAASILPLDFKVLAPYDYHLYLCEFRGRQYVIIETDYLSGLPGIVKDAEKAFPVVAKGWRVLNEHRKEAGRDFLPADADDYDPDGTSDESHKNYLYTILEAHGMRYAVLAVKPRK
jgi:hypothetical protein